MKAGSLEEMKAWSPPAFSVAVLCRRERPPTLAPRSSLKAGSLEEIKKAGSLEEMKAWSTQRAAPLLAEFDLEGRKP